PRTVSLSLAEAGTMRMQAEHGASFAMDLVVRWRWPRHLGGGSGIASGRCPPRALLPLEFPVRAGARGAAGIEPPFASWSRWGLVDRIAPVGAPTELMVLPNLAAVRRLHQQLNAYFLRGQGSRMAPRIGQGREFDRLRDYVAGDDYRHLAWKASARRGRLILREFRVERSQDVLLCIDRGHRMAAVVHGPGGPLSRTDHAVNAGVLSAWLCNRCEDRVGMLSFSADVQRGVVQGRGSTHLAAITRFATGIAPSWTHTDYRQLAAHLRRRLRQRTLVMIATVLPERGDHGELLTAVRMLASRHLPLVLVLDDGALAHEAQALPDDAAGLSRTLVANDLVDGRRQLIKELRQLGALVVETTPADSGVAAVNAYLDVKRRQLL
ncbi:MAG: DUF58 domain-containing protein, partial [Planctomycetes bacterium]|nr:DUF58 domain-containing protein [Planctomycetota bacterium]